MELFDLRYLVIREVREVRPMSGDEEWEDVEVDGPVKVDEEESVGRNDREAGAEKKELFVNEDAKSEGEIKGFMSFMPTYEDGIKVVYLYEIHLIDELRGFVALFLMSPYPVCSTLMHTQDWSRHPLNDPPRQCCARDSWCQKDNVNVFYG